MRDWTRFDDTAVHLEEGPWWTFLLEWAALNLCRFIPSIPLPPIPFKLSPEDAEWNDGEEWATLRSWYGDLRQTYCAFVCNDFVNWLGSFRTTTHHRLVPGTGRILNRPTLDKTDTTV